MSLYRTCTKCFLHKPIEEFGWKDRTRNKRHAVCKECTAKRSSDWYYANRKHHIQNVGINSKAYRDEARQYVWEYLSEHSCINCGESDPVVLEFHHIGEKEADIAEMVGRGWSFEKIKAEIEKCVVLCGNCHKKLTARERGWFRARK